MVGQTIAILPLPCPSENAIRRCPVELRSSKRKNVRECASLRNASGKAIAA